MTIFEPRGYYGSIGKDIPTAPHQRFLRPSYGRGAIVTGAYQIGKYLFKNRKFFTRLGAVGAGAIVTGVPLGNEGRYTIPKTLRTKYSNKRGSSGRWICRPMQRCTCGRQKGNINR